MNKYAKTIVLCLGIIIYYATIRYALYSIIVGGSYVNAVATLDATEPATSAQVSNGTQALTDAVYQGDGVGYKGKIYVDVSFSGDRITAIEIVDTVDDYNWVSDVKRYLLPKIISEQSADIDVVSGATYTSKGVLAAVADALTKRNEEVR